MNKAQLHRLVQFVLIAIISYITLIDKVNGQSRDLKQLLDFMEGEFTSELQARQDSAFYPIYLGMHRIWTNNKDGGWFYVEQSLMSKKDKPYRQRIYHVYEEGDQFLSDIYMFENPLEFSGNLKKVEKLKMEDLKLKKGCTVYLKKINRKLFAGNTKSGTCTSTLRGANYATSVVKIKPNQIYSWDKGFDSEGNQVWGAIKGGYLFKKL